MRLHHSISRTLRTSVQLSATAGDPERRGTKRVANEVLRTIFGGDKAAGRACEWGNANDRLVMDRIIWLGRDVLV